MSRIDLVALAQGHVANVLCEGDIAVDATAGNGYDTLFLARTVGREGRVYSFDIQKHAIASTRQLLETHHLEQRVTLIENGHESMQSNIPAHCHGAMKAVMFNLGYLPGHSKSVTTVSATTLRALDAATRLLAPGGIITVLAYTGHSGGRGEADDVKAWARELDHSRFGVTITVPPACSSPPELFVIKTIPGNSAQHSCRSHP